mgnify:CR=1 FL=1
MSDETLPLDVSETLRIGIHARTNQLVENITSLSRENIILERDEIVEAIEYLEEHGTACSTTSVRRGLVELDRLITSLPDEAS